MLSIHEGETEMLPDTLAVRIGGYFTSQCGSIKESHTDVILPVSSHLRMNVSDFWCE